MNKNYTEQFLDFFDDYFFIFDKASFKITFLKKGNKTLGENLTIEEKIETFFFMKKLRISTIRRYFHFF